MTDHSDPAAPPAPPSGSRASHEAAQDASSPKASIPIAQQDTGSGTSVGYRIEVRCRNAFVAWNIKGYECLATPHGEFVVDHDWKPVPLAAVQPPNGIGPQGLFAPEFHPDLVCYETAKALQYSILAWFRNKPFFDARIVKVATHYTFKTTTMGEAPKSSMFECRFEAES